RSPSKFSNRRCGSAPVAPRITPVHVALRRLGSGFGVYTEISARRAQGVDALRGLRCPRHSTGTGPGVPIGPTDSGPVPKRIGCGDPYVRLRHTHSAGPKRNRAVHQRLNGSWIAKKKTKSIASHSEVDGCFSDAP